MDSRDLHHRVPSGEGERRAVARSVARSVTLESLGALVAPARPDRFTAPSGRHLVGAKPSSSARRRRGGSARGEDESKYLWPTGHGGTVCLGDPRASTALPPGEDDGAVRGA